MGGGGWGGGRFRGEERLWEEEREGDMGGKETEEGMRGELAREEHGGKDEKWWKKGSEGERK